MFLTDLTGATARLQRLLDETDMRNELRKRVNLFAAGVAEDIPVHLRVLRGLLMDVCCDGVG